MSPNGVSRSPPPARLEYEEAVLPPEERRSGATIDGKKFTKTQDTRSAACRKRHFTPTANTSAGNRPGFLNPKVDGTGRDTGKRFKAPSPPARMAATDAGFVLAETDKWGKVAKFAGIKPE